MRWCIERFKLCIKKIGVCTKKHYLPIAAFAIIGSIIGISINKYIR